LIVCLMIGALAGIALPNIQFAIYQANAAKVVSDARAVELAARNYSESTDSLPPGGGWGAVPPELAPYLPAGMPFTYQGVDYRLVTQVSPPSSRLEVQYAAADGTGLALQGFAGPNVTWTATRTTFWFP
jgi:type II secretory pathway pseudopilin PulG